MDEDFIPFPWCEGKHQQTIIGSMLGFETVSIPSATRLIPLKDGDSIGVEVSTPPNWKEEEQTVMLVHGLCGSHRSKNLMRVAKRLYDKGIRSVRVNLRGCGSGRGHAKGFYHSGSSPDIEAVVRALKGEYPASPLTLVGYSLGGSISLKLAGELGEEGKQLLHQVIAISPPADLKASVHMLGQPSNQFYERYFVYLLLSDVKFRQKHLKVDVGLKLPLTLSIYEFDEQYVAPRLGYSSAFEYYEQCSAKRFIPQIQVPCQILFAQDDPIVDANSLDKIEKGEHIKITKTKRGGHLGFLAHPKEGFRWMDRMIIRWITGDSEGRKESSCDFEATG